MEDLSGDLLEAGVALRRSRRHQRHLVGLGPPRKGVEVNLRGDWTWESRDFSHRYWNRSVFPLLLQLLYLYGRKIMKKSRRKWTRN